MHRLAIVAAAASILSVGGVAHAGWNGGYSGGSYAPPCGCQGYGSSGYGYSDEAPYVDEDDGYYARSYGYRSDDYVPFESSTEGYSYEDVYGRGDYSYEGRDYRDYRHEDEGPRYRSYSYGYDDRRRRARPYSYRSYRYTPPHYGRPTYRYRSHYGHSSTDGERG